LAYLPRYFTSGDVLTLPPELVLPHWITDADVPATTARNRRRYERRKANTVGERYRLRDIAERDACRCHLCGKPVDMTLSGRHPQGPTADHLVPVSCGGGDEPHNVALAHRRCNVKRGIGGAVQLRVV
jgi:5-methylcytosine-specific restriction endonuclease McrA